jgi:hypothetical protein
MRMPEPVDSPFQHQTCRDNSKESETCTMAK